MLRLKFDLHQSWVLPLAIFIFFIPLLILEYPLLQYSKGVFVYPMDEAYIRMTIAKNIALHGSWGLSGNEFSSSSSSILYPLILAMLYKVIGINLICPFLINLATAIICLTVIQRWLLREGIKPTNQLLILAAIILLTPVPVLVVGGMEHMLQVLFSVLFLIRFCTWLTSGGQYLPWNIYTVGILVTATRYEGLFIILVACVALLIKRRLRLCIILGMLSVLPVVIFGIYSLRHDAYFFPTSLVMKAFPIPLDGVTVRKFFTDDIFTRLVYTYNTVGSIATTRLLIVLPLLYWLFFRSMKELVLYRAMLVFILCVTILHLIFGSVVLFFRYEAYLMAFSVLVAGPLIAKGGSTLWPRKGIAARWVAAWTCILLLYPLFSRGWAAFKDIYSECLNTYEQAYQAAGFIHRYYNEAAVITDDIGTASYQSEGRKMDISTGIGYMEIARSREGSYLRVDYADYLIKQERPALAIIRDNRYSYELLQHWVKVADWLTNNQVVFRSTHLSIYALDSASAPMLKRQLQVYEPLLPSAVKAVYP